MIADREVIKVLRFLSRADYDGIDWEALRGGYPASLDEVGLEPYLELRKSIALALLVRPELKTRLIRNIAQKLGKKYVTLPWTIAATANLIAEKGDELNRNGSRRIRDYYIGEIG